MEQNLLLGQGLGLLTAICIAHNAVVFRYLGQRLGSESVAHTRMWLALPLVLILTRVVEGVWYPTGWALSTHLILLTSGVLGYFLTDLLMFRAYVLLGSRESMVIMTLSPVVTALFSLRLFNERLSMVQSLGMLVTIGGIATMTLLDGKGDGQQSKGSNKLRGVIYAMVAAVLQSVSFLLAKYALTDGTPVATNLVRTVGGLGSFVIFNVIIKRNAKTHFQGLRNPRYLGLLLLASIAGPVVGMSSQMKAFTLAPVALVSTIVQISPILLLPFDYLILKRKVSTASLVGTLLSIGGIALLFLAV